MSANAPLNKNKPNSSIKEKQKVHCGGGGGFDFRPEIEAQDFYQLRDKCLAEGILFEDPVFPPQTIPLDDNHTVREWKRPGEIVPNPQFFKDGFSRFDVEQNELGNCWFLAAMAKMTIFRRLFFQVVPKHQNFDENYAGIFHFRFWHFGRWTDVVVDDRLPVIENRLVFAQSSEPNEFWSALLEKAYAKLNGSYLALDGGWIVEAMEDFTGGACERHSLEKLPPNLFEILLQAYKKGSMIGCCSESDQESKEAEGIVQSHGYSITKVVLLDVSTKENSKKHQLVRIRNPWGNKVEWKGRWSDGSEEWSSLSEEQKKDLGLTCDEDGEFWMSYEEFLTKFASVAICYLGPESLPDGGHKKRWVVSMCQGKWVKGLTAGGSPDNKSFFKNPQYRFTLSEADEGDEKGYCTVIVSLMQSRRQTKAKNHEVDFLAQSFHIWRIHDTAPKPLDMKYFNSTVVTEAFPCYFSGRGITHRCKLPKGTYCLVPSTSEPNEEGEFFLRVISEHKINLEEYGKCSK